VRKQASVPGGQTVFVTPDGVIQYTNAHSAFLPAGAVQHAFTPETLTNCQPSVSVFSWKAFGLKGFLACPLPPELDGVQGEFVVLVDTYGDEVPIGCWRVEGIRRYESSVAYGAYEY
jgi:hypothetical protein